MTRTHTNVVPFERPAAYWAGKARRHYTPSQLPDAARMMRKALEKSGDPSLALELAEIYQGMGCYTAAERCLIRVSARYGLTGRLCFLIACSALNRGDEDLAEEALDQSLRMDPTGLYNQRVQDLLEAYPWRRPEYWPRCARSDALCRRSIRAFSLGDPEESKRLAKKAWSRGHSPRTALWLGIQCTAREALPYLRFAVKKLPKDLKAHLFLAQAAKMAGRPPECRQHLALARPLCRTMADAEAYCSTAWLLHRPQDALKLAEAKLAETPLSVDYLRLKYQSLQEMGAADLARRTLEALLEIDPDDADALMDRRRPRPAAVNPARGMLLSALGSMVYALPTSYRPSPLNRALHTQVMALNGTVSADTVLRLLTPAWKILTPAEKRACDEQSPSCVSVALTVYLLEASGHGKKARELYQASPGKKRMLRLLRRLMKGDAPHALHQF